MASSTSSGPATSIPGSAVTSAWPTNTTYYQLPFGPIGPQNGNTGITLTQFHHFKKCPAEVRNMIYKQLIVSKKTIQICSPLKRHRRRYHSERLNFAAIMLVDKDIHEEVRGLYYTLNTFAVGNNLWGSTSFANLHGLNAFMKLAPKQHLAQIQNIEINLCAELVPHWARPELFYCHDELDGKRLMSICRILLKHFRGLRHVVIKACEMDMKPVTSGKDKRMRPIVQQGDWENAGKALRLLLDGNRKGSRGLLGLNIQRFRWYVNQNIQWSRVPDCAPGAKTRPSFAGFVEQGRPELLNEEGVWDPMGITDKTMDQVRSKEFKNARAGIV
ncbi:uncharacterized protein RAG0_10997 [Rhynchosporium agropyri]|uniref:Uncharacterized protein n=1 Tax=Rhynchosporium agropyri TaxID=914238 RepID=A0A1E1L286_9HELO|nr:uncharacterized protein RAG0_10997 [Rhynchosporium agropyri]